MNTFTRKSPYPLFFRERVLNFYLSSTKNTIKDTINKFKISKGTLFNWISLNKINKLKPKKIRKSKFSEEIINYITKYVLKKENFNRFILQKLIAKKFKVKISLASIYNILKINYISFKKQKTKIILKNLKEHNKMKLKMIKKLKTLNVDDIISIDEVSFDNHMQSIYCWSKKGDIKIKINNNSRIRITAIAAISNKKVLLTKLIKGSANGNDFKNFLKDLNNKISKNKILFMDNARIHHFKEVHKFINSTSHKILYNVPYCPEYNPIEMAFSKVKNIFRKQNNKSFKEFKNNINKSFSKLTSKNLKNYYLHILK